MRIKILTYYSVLSLLLLLVNTSIIAQTPQQAIQTAYLEKFTNYIEWPKNIISDDVFKIAIIGNPNLCKLVNSAFSTRTIKDKKAEVICSRGIENIQNIDIVFLTSNKVKDLEAAIELCNNQSCLLITDSDGFAKRGAHINFYITKEQTLHFEMNKASLDKDNFKVDFLLLDFAKVIKQ